LAVAPRFILTCAFFCLIFGVNILPSFAAAKLDSTPPQQAFLDPSWQLSANEIKRMASGKLVLHDTSASEGYVKELRVFLIVKSTPKQLLALITNYEKLPEFMPNLEHIEVLEQDKNGALANYFLDLPLGIHKRYRLQLSYDKTTPRYTMSWQSVPWQGLKPEETINYTMGSWLFSPIDNDETLLVYYTKTDPGHVPFGLGWIVDYLTKKTVLELLKNTRKRAENIEKQSKSHKF